MTAMHIQPFFDPATSSVSYVVADMTAKVCAVIDPILDFEAASGRLSYRSADAVIGYICGEGLRLVLILETHVHADHLSAAVYLKSKLGGRTAIGAHVVDVQKIFAKIFNLDDSFAADGRAFDVLFEDGETFSIGGLKGRVMHTPGHTSGCLTYLFEDAAFVGDTLFMPDYGTARTDFPGGDARTLYRSIRRILALPEATRIFTGHDYKPASRDAIAWESTVAEQRRANIHIRDGVGENEFVVMRTARDKILSAPQLIIPAIQVNIRGGELPPAEDNGVVYLKFPINGLKPRGR
jgi:glyoxylase-like metal-dependent hydrolase (beta-lactamase superfamily II)